MKKIISKIAPTLAVLALMSSCGSDNSSSNKSKGNAIVPEREETPLSTDGSNIQGLYLAKFETLNPHVNGNIPGSVTIQRKDARIYAYLRLFGGGVKTWHRQGIYTGDRCPTQKDDENGDGFVDIVEAEKVLGKIIIPLDADIGSQASGRNFYPVADLSGNYHYERITSFERFFRDLKSPDKDPEDNVVKLGPEEGFDFVGKPVLVQGVVETTVFPPTVGSMGRYKPFQTLPIVCGIFQKAETMPGVPNDGMIPGPVAEVEDGQDRPAANGEGETAGNGQIPTGGSNEAETGDTPTEERNNDREEENDGPSDYGRDDDEDDEEEEEPRPNTSTGSSSSSSSSGNSSGGTSGSSNGGGSGNGTSGSSTSGSGSSTGSTSGTSSSGSTTGSSSSSGSTSGSSSSSNSSSGGSSSGSSRDAQG